MRISIVIPTYRPKEYLWQMLESIDSQTLDHTLFEVLLILNGERQPYEQEITSFLSKHPGLPCRLIYNDVKGVSAARNRGIDEAQGEYICFVDDDDLITPTYLQQLLTLASKDTVPLSYISAFDDGTDDYRPLYITQDYQEYSGSIPYTRARRYFYIPYCKILHRDIIGDRRFDLSLKNGEDALFMFLISDRMKWVHFTDRMAEYRYRQRETSAFNARQPMRYHVTNMLQCQFRASRIYWAHPFRYAFGFYVKYLMATAMGCIRHLRNIRQ